MKVKDIIEQLKECNPEAEVQVIAKCMPYKFSLSYGGSEGATKLTCANVSFYVDELNTNDEANTD